MFSADVLSFYMYIGGLQMLCDDDDYEEIDSGSPRLYWKQEL